MDSRDGDGIPDIDIPVIYHRDFGDGSERSKKYTRVHYGLIRVSLGGP